METSLESQSQLIEGEHLLQKPLMMGDGFPFINKIGLDEKGGFASNYDALLMSWRQMMD